MAYEVKGRVVINRPLRYQPPKKDPRERPYWIGPVTPRLRPKDGFVQAVGFTAKIVNEDD